MKPVLAVFTVLCVVALLFWHGYRPRFSHPEQTDAPATETETSNLSPTPSALNSTPRNSADFRKRLSEFSEAERRAFESDFQERYKSAITKWAAAYEGHLPFSANDVTPDKLLERIGKDASFREHVFVVNGITLGLRDQFGNAAVDYLNNPLETTKLATLPKNQGPPKTTRPISREKLIQMFEADCGHKFQPHEVRIKPSGFSGSLNGGSLVQVGGDPRNNATWQYDLVISADGNLAFYLRTF